MRHAPFGGSRDAEPEAWRAPNCAQQHPGDCQEARHGMSLL